jgi:hypothetical protein
MVKITNGINVFEVTKGAFDGIYSRQGYHLMDETKEVQEDKIPEKTEDELFIEGVLEKPISQWNKDEVKMFAELKEIDITGTKNAGEAKERIKEFLDAQGQE